MAFNDYLRIILLIIILGLPFWVGFLFAVLYRKTKPKILWFTLWVLILAAIIGGITYLSSFILFDEEGFEYAYPLLSILSASLFLVLYFICFWFSKIFNIRRKIHWLCLLSIPAISFGILFLFFYVGSLKPWSFIEDKALQKEALENAQGADYDIEQIFSDAWHFTYSTVVFRERNDSAFYRIKHSICSKQDSIDIDLNSWIPLDNKKTALVKKLKKAIEEYEAEVATNDVLDGYYSRTELRDYKQETQRNLGFSNAVHYGTRRATEIEKLANQIRPEPEKLEAFTTLTEEEVKQKCKERRGEDTPLHKKGDPGTEAGVTL